MFWPDPDASTDGTGFLTQVRCPPVRLYELFGWPELGDGHKVSGQYVFVNEKGDVFTVYDWEETYLYHGLGEGYPAPHEFWSDLAPADLRVGGRTGSDPQPFVKWLLEEVGRFDDPPQLVRVISPDY